MSTKEIKISILAAVSPFMANDGVRAYLKSVLIEFYENGWTAVATDRHILGIAQEKSGISLGNHISSVMLPRSIVLNILKNSRAGDIATIWQDNELVFARSRGNTFGDSRIPYEYLGWRDSIPREITGVSASFDGELIRKICDCAKLYKKYEPEISDETLGIQLDQNFKTASFWSLTGLKEGVSIVGCIMPLMNVKSSAFENISQIVI